MRQATPLNIFCENGSLTDVTDANYTPALISPLFDAKTMSTLLEIRDAHKSYGAQTLMDGAAVTLHEGQKVGFIGRNGAGKSTLCKILLEQEELDRGEVIKHPRLKLGYLQQHDPFESDESALDFLRRDTGEPEWRCGDVAGDFELKGRFLEGPVKELSGGWQTRVKLAALLLQDPTLLVLDEPTNFLDLRTQILLEHFLKNFKAACLVISHDRSFLKATCEQTLELSRGQLTLYPGKIDKYLETKKEQKEIDQRANASVIAKQKQLETFINKNRANASTASQARSKAKQLERLQTTKIEREETRVRIKIPRVDPRQGPALRCHDLKIGYPDHVVADEIDVEIDHQTRVAIVGDNGQGKTTFLRTIVGSLDPMGGHMKWGFGCELGVYAQHVYTTLPEDWTIQQYLDSEASRDNTMQQVLEVAGSFLFTGDILNKKIKVLSGGERARLCLAGLLLGSSNVLILDEPGNHLDVETVEALAAALITYKGTVIFTSHDRYFMSLIATDVVEVRDGGVAAYSGDYDSYVYRVNKEVDEGERERNAKSAASKKENTGKNSAKAKGPRDPKKRIADIEKEIAKLNGKIEVINEKFLTVTDPEESQTLHEEMMRHFEKIGELEDEWLELDEA